MGEYALTLKELSTSAQMVFEETQQHSRLSFMPDQQHLSQNSWCPTGNFSINFSFPLVKPHSHEAVPRKSKKFLLSLLEAGISPLPSASFLSLSLVKTTLPVL